MQDIAAETPRPEPRGLVNLGNTCFLNAALQNLVAATPWRAHFLRTAGATGDGAFTSALRKFVVAMHADSPGAVSRSEGKESSSLSPI